MTDSEKSRLLNDFSYDFGWTPNDRLYVPTVEDISSAHLVIEHGLENQAVISFLKKPYNLLTKEEEQKLLGVSYNNLVDWHIQIERDQIIYMFNRYFPFEISWKENISRNSLSYLSSDAFQKRIQKKPSFNLPVLDNALIKTIEYWKRNLAAELSDENVGNKELSSLFNAVIFIRAVEDNYRNSLLTSQSGNAENFHILKDCISNIRGDETLVTAIRNALNILEQGNRSQELINFSDLNIFTKLDKYLLIELVDDFYRVKQAKPFEYDFSIMSKHALSRIYEKYTSVLQQVDSPQLSLFPELPVETKERGTGNFYTPHFIARFFARYLRSQVPHYAFKKIKTFEPSVGSGIFLRTLLEYQCDLTQEGLTTELIKQAFENFLGIDIDPNACQASTLSLSLLYLALVNQLPLKLNIVNGESVEYFQEHAELNSSFDAVISNPPFISLVDQDEATRSRLAKFMGSHAKGKIDYYLAFLKIALEVLKPSGYGLFIVPHNFLISESSSGMRQLLSEQTWIRSIVDLSGLKVFPDADAYVILLIFQKKYKLDPPPSSLIAQCRSLVSDAFQAVLENKEENTPLYSTFELPQKVFESKQWILLPPVVSQVHHKITVFPKISDFMEINVGIQTGQNKTFLFDKEEIPRKEEVIFKPYLPDRDMVPYTVPSSPSQYILYPYDNGKLISLENIKKEFPKTWSYLITKEEDLRSRSSVSKGQIEWWALERPRVEYIYSPKIVVPHLLIRPRFSVDLDGEFAVIRSPIVLPKQSLEMSKELLKYFVAVLNSTVCYKFISENASRYGSGYTMLEKRTLSETPVPDPNKVEPRILSELLSLVDIRLKAKGKEIIQAEEKIDQIISNLYGLTQEDVINYSRQPR